MNSETETKPQLAPNIMVVDDVPANLQMLTDVLKAKGYRVRPVPSGELALAAAGREVPDLVLLDINMPGMNGYEVCQRLKSDPQLAAVPVIFITALNDVADKVKGFELGAVDFVTKPFEFQEVEARVSAHLELARLRQQLKRHNECLEEVVAQRTLELAEANARLAILDRAKSDFLSLISHEIRTPLNGIMGVVELLLLNLSDDSEAAKYSEMYRQSRQRLMMLLDDALLFTQIGTDASVQARPSCRLDELLSRARLQAVPFANSRMVQLAAVPPDLGLVQGSADYLARALQSLFETGIKFARTGTIIKLARITAPGEIGLIIEADGLAIPLELLPRFFDLLAISELILPGGGLGLAPALAERILTLYGGMVSVENMKPPGIRLTVRLKSAE
jgi:two-component system, sensor histidine kinase and response regulator